MKCMSKYFPFIMQMWMWVNELKSTCSSYVQTMTENMIFTLWSDKSQTKVAMSQTIEGCRAEVETPGKDNNFVVR